MPWQNVRLSAQYTAYTKFNGGTTNYDGFGRNASWNNTLYRVDVADVLREQQGVGSWEFGSSR